MVGSHVDAVFCCTFKAIGMLSHGTEMGQLFDAVQDGARFPELAGTRPVVAEPRAVTAEDLPPFSYWTGVDCRQPRVRA